jgi:uncharacterized membrane protein YkvA (DUF1232 family)
MAASENARNGMDEERINREFAEHQRRAEEALGDEAKSRTALEGAWKKLKSITAKPILAIREDICLLMDVIKAYITGRYRKIPFRTLAMILGALTYFSWPFDAIFDLIPVIGFLDDVFVIGMVLKFAYDDLQSYKKWEASQSKVKADAGTAVKSIVPPPITGLGL